MNMSFIFQLMHMFNSVLGSQKNGLIEMVLLSAPKTNVFSEK